MRRLWLLLPLVVAGCQRPATPVYVNLDSLVPSPTAPSHPENRIAAMSALPPANGTLSGVQGAQLALGDAQDRIREAKETIAANRQLALRGLTRALYRSYSRAVEADRTLKEQELEAVSEELWDRAFEAISALLQSHARERLPSQNVLALLVGFPYTDPAQRPRPENVHLGRRYDEAVEAWKKLLEADREFAAAAQNIIDLVHQELSARQLQIQIDFSKQLNEAADRSDSEARAAIASSLPDFAGTLSQQPDQTLPPVPAESVTLPAVQPAPIGLPKPIYGPLDLRREFLEHELAIWLAQNGYTLAPTAILAPDRTKEFQAWTQKRRPGL